MEAAIDLDRSGRFATLRRRIAGAVIERGAPDYPKVRDAMVWNELKPQRSPELIVRVKSAADVAAAIDFARANAMKVGVRGPGGNALASSV